MAAAVADDRINDFHERKNILIKSLSKILL